MSAEGRDELAKLTSLLGRMTALQARWQQQGVQEHASAALSAAEQRRALWLAAPEAVQ